MKRWLLVWSLLLVLLCPPVEAQYMLSSGTLGRKLSVNMNATSDQAIAITCSSNKYVIRRITVLNASTSLTTAAGGFYTTTSKGGSALVASTQVYSALTGSTKFVDMTLASVVGTDVRTETTLYLSLTTAQGATATADVYILGDCFQ